MPKTKSTIESRYEAVMRLKQGESFKSVSKSLHISIKTLHLLVIRYDKYGIDGLEEKRNSFYPEAIKLHILRDYQNNSLSLKEVCEKYDVACKTFERWLSAYDAYKKGDKFALNGNGAIRKCDFGHNVTNIKPVEKPKEMLESKERQERRKALSRLSKKELQELLLDREAELDLLKNLEALDQERDAQRHAMLRELSRD